MTPGVCENKMLQALVLSPYMGSGIAGLFLTLKPVSPILKYSKSDFQKTFFIHGNSLGSTEYVSQIQRSVATTRSSGKIEITGMGPSH
jgi:hypothetical protein